MKRKVWVGQQLRKKKREDELILIIIIIIICGIVKCEERGVRGEEERRKKVGWKLKEVLNGRVFNIYCSHYLVVLITCRGMIKILYDLQKMFIIVAPALMSNSK